MQIKLFEFFPLYKSMKNNGVSIEQYYATYNKIKFDIIFDISNKPFELLIGAVSHNWACVFKMEKGFSVTMNDSDFYSLCQILDLKAGKESFTSFKFLKFVANKAPKYTSNILVNPAHLIRFRKNFIKITDEPDKIYFKGWNNHLTDGRTAHNFDKTEKLLGKAVADYCRENNISSIWSSNPKDIKPPTFPKKQL